MLMYAAHRSLQGVSHFFIINLKGKKLNGKTALMMAFEADHSSPEK